MKRNAPGPSIWLSAPAGRSPGADSPGSGGVLRVPGGDAAVPPVFTGSQGPPGAVPGGVRGFPPRGGFRSLHDPSLFAVLGAGLVCFPR